MGDRVSKVERLKELEESIRVLENNLLGIDSPYFTWGYIRMKIDTSDFRFKPLESDERVEFTKSIMIDFMKHQLEQHREESRHILKDLISE